MSTNRNNSSKPVQTFPIKNTAWSGPPAPSAHVHKPLKQVLQPRDLVALQKVRTPNNGRTVHLDEAFKKEIKSFVELGILELVTEHTDGVNSYVTVVKDVQMDNS